MSAQPRRGAARLASVAFALALLLIVAGSAVGLHSASTRSAYEAWIHHSNAVLADLDAVGVHAASAEAAVRGYVLTGDHAYLARGSAELDEARRALARAQALTSHDERQRVLLTALGWMLDRRHAHADSVVRQVQLGDTAGVLALVRQGGGERLSGYVRHLLADARTHERVRLGAEMAGEQRAAGRVVLVLALIIVAAVAATAAGVLALRHEWTVARRALRATRAAESALRAREAQLRGAFDASLDAILLYRAARDGAGDVVDFDLVDCNAPAAVLLPLPHGRPIGARLTALFPSVRDDGVLQRFVQAAETRRPVAFDTRLPATVGSSTWVRLQVVPTNGGIVVTARDVSEERQATEALRELAYLDELTGLLNRRGFLHAAEHAWQRAAREHHGVVAAYLDLDGFKAINDVFGHAEGDTALRTMAEVLRTALPATSLIARLGGDEFAVLIVPDAPAAMAADLQAVERALRERVAERLADGNASAQAAGRPYVLRSSMGTASVPSTTALLDDGTPPAVDALLRLADERLYDDKRRRRETTPQRVVSPLRSTNLRSA